MSSQRKPSTHQSLNCTDCDETVRKTASGTYVCTGCGRTSTARLVR